MIVDCGRRNKRVFSKAMMKPQEQNKIKILTFENLNSSK